MITVLVDCRTNVATSNGGIPRYFREILPRVAAQSPDIRIVLLWPPGVPGAWRGPGISVWPQINFRPGRLFGRINSRLDAWRLRRLKPNVFHSTYYTRSPVPGVRSLVTVHDMIDEHFFDTMSANPSGFRRHLRAIVQEADHIIAVSQTTRDDVVKFAGFPTERVSVCYHGCADRIAQAPPAALRQQFQGEYRTGPDYFLYVGHHMLYKNFGTLLEGWASFRKRSPQRTKLVCVTPPGFLAAHHCELLVRTRLAQDFVFIHNLDDTALACAYSGARALVLPSLWEGFGIPILEAAANSIPLVLSDIPAFREIAGDNALYFDPADPEKLAGALEQISSADECRRLVRLAASIPGRFSWNTAAAEHAAIYRKLAAR